MHSQCSITIICSFTLATETKSGRIVKTPGKFSTCVSGKRKIHKARKPEISVLINTSLETAFVEDQPASDNLSMAVNTSQTTQNETMTDLDTTAPAFADTYDDNSTLQYNPTESDAG